MDSCRNSAARRWTTLAVCLVLSVLGVADRARAQGPGAVVRAEIEQSPVTVGRPFTYTIIVEGRGGAERPDLSMLADRFGVRDNGTSQSSYTTIENGRSVTTTQVQYHYQMRVLEPGSYAVPPITVRVGGQSVRTPEVRFQAAMAPETEEFQVRIEVDNPAPFVGQPVRFTMTIYTTSNFSSPQITVGGDVARFDATDVPNWQGERQGHRPFDFLDGQVQPVVTRSVLDGRVYTAASVARRLIPREPGPARLGPVSVSTEFVAMVRRGLFERQRPVKDVMARWDAISVNVRPLPDDGRPPSFGGLVGEYGVRTEADRTDVNVGDPIELQVLVTGGPLLQDVTLPDLDALPGFEGRLRVSTDSPDRMFSANGVVFTVGLRAVDDTVDAIPPVEIAYFDPSSERYRVARSKPIPLNVRATRRVTARDAVGTGPVASGAGVETVRTGIAANYEGSDALRSVPSGVLAELRSPGWIVAIGAPPALWAACGLVVVARRGGGRRDAARRRGRALGRAETAIGSAHTVAGVVDAIREYLAVVSGRPAPSITPRDAEAIVAPAEDAPRLRELLEQCDAVQYASGDDDLATLRDRARDLLRSIDPDVRRRA